MDLKVPILAGKRESRLRNKVKQLEVLSFCARESLTSLNKDSRANVFGWKKKSTIKLLGVSTFLRIRQKS